MFMMPNEKYTHISSSLIKEVASLGGSVDDYVPSEILLELNKKLNENSK
jgi:pantetheine-phosphate adenylyltransferase